MKFLWIYSQKMYHGMQYKVVIKYIYKNIAHNLNIQQIYIFEIVQLQ
jgi:hypothetical protein